MIFPYYQRIPQRIKGLWDVKRERIKSACLGIDDFVYL